MKIEFIKMGINGEGIGYINHIPVFCQGVFPGEEAIVEITEDNPKYKKADLIKITKKSEHRIQTSCKQHVHCGGCSLITLDPSQQNEWKKKLLEEALWKYARVRSTMVRDLKASPSHTHYRNQCKLPIGEENGKLVSGMYRTGTNHFVPIETCAMHDPVLEDTRNHICDILDKHGYHAYQNGYGIRYIILRHLQGKTQCTLITGKDKIKKETVEEIMQLPYMFSVAQSVNTIRKNHTLFGSKSKVLAGEKEMPIQLKGITLFLSPESFFQMNFEQAEKMYDMAVSKINPGDELVEAYCGVGAMSLLAKDRAKRVTGIEIVPQAIENANRAVEFNRVPNAKFICGDSAEELAKILMEKHVDTLLADPPRSGLDDSMVKTILDSDISKVIYISCNPATLGKNLKELKKEYDIRTIVPFDMFPCTPHVESLTVLQRRGTTDKITKNKKNAA